MEIIDGEVCMGDGEEHQSSYGDPYYANAEQHYATKRSDSSRVGAEAAAAVAGGSRGRGRGRGRGAASDK